MSTLPSSRYTQERAGGATCRPVPACTVTMGGSMRIVFVAWVLTVVTLIGVALAVAFWTECAAPDVVIAGIPPERRSVEILARGWRSVGSDSPMWCRPRLYRLF